MARIDDIGRDIPSDPTVNEIYDNTRQKVRDIVKLLLKFTPIEEATEKTLEEVTPELYDIIKELIRDVERLQVSTETLDALRFKRMEHKGDLQQILEKAISGAFVLENMSHEAIVQYMLEENIDNLEAIVNGLSEETKTKLKETLQ